MRCGWTRQNLKAFPNVNVTTYLGDGNAFFNTYSLMTTRAIADGLRDDFIDAQGARVFFFDSFLLCRSTAIRRYVWSGDTSGNISGIVTTSGVCKP